MLIEPTLSIRFNAPNSELSCGAGCTGNYFFTSFINAELVFFYEAVGPCKSRSAFRTIYLEPLFVVFIFDVDERCVYSFINQQKLFNFWNFKT